MLGKHSVMALEGVLEGEWYIVALGSRPPLVRLNNLDFKCSDIGLNAWDMIQSKERSSAANDSSNFGKGRAQLEKLVVVVTASIMDTPSRCLKI